MLKSSLPFSVAVKLPLEVSEGDRVMLPGVQGFKLDGEVVLNPSYFVFPEKVSCPVILNKPSFSPFCQALSKVPPFPSLNFPGYRLHKPSQTSFLVPCGND